LPGVDGRTIAELISKSTVDEMQSAADILRQAQFFAAKQQSQTHYAQKSLQHTCLGWFSLLANTTNP